MKTIQLTQGKVTMVDDADYEWLNSVKWYASKSSCKFYAARGKRIGGIVTTIYMHRAIIAGDLDCTDSLNGREIDHKDRNTLDNRRDNLRECSRQENLKNRFYKRSEK